MLADLLIHNTSEVLTCGGPAPRRGGEQADARSLPRAVVASYEGLIVFVGGEADWRSRGRLIDGATIIDAANGAVVPGFVDAHTHVLYAGQRRDELRRRLAGDTYENVAATGGGILATVGATRAASEEQLFLETRGRLDEMLRCGTTTAEVKSGYGLTTESEVRMLGVVARLDREHAIELSPTFMGAHELPPEYRDRRRAYVDLVRHEMIPAVANARLAEWCDVFCEDGVFTPEESRNILEDARRGGLKLRIHADEFGPSGGSRVAAEMRVRSADHLVFVDVDAARNLAGVGTVATLLPAASFYLKLGRFAPARMLIEQGVPVALATDVNPGGGFSPSLPFAMALGCFCMGLTFEEALVGVTINAAYALDRHERVGSLEPGRQMDAVVMKGPAIDMLRIGVETIRLVVKKGCVVYGA